MSKTSWNASQSRNRADLFDMEFRFANNLPSTALGARFYAGVPLFARTSGHSSAPSVAIGTLCVADDKPREEFSEAHRRVLYVQLFNFDFARCIYSFSTPFLDEISEHKRRTRLSSGLRNEWRSNLLDSTAHFRMPHYRISPRSPIDRTHQQKFPFSLLRLRLDYLLLPTHRLSLFPLDQEPRQFTHLLLPSLPLHLNPFVTLARSPTRVPLRRSLRLSPPPLLDPPMVNDQLPHSPSQSRLKILSLSYHGNSRKCSIRRQRCWRKLSHSTSSTSQLSISPSPLPMDPLFESSRLEVYHLPLLPSIRISIFELFVRQKEDSSTRTLVSSQMDRDRTLPVFSSRF